VLRGEGLVRSWGPMPAGSSVHWPGDGGHSLSPLILPPGTSERARAPSSPCATWGSWGPLGNSLARTALVGDAQPQPPWPLLADPSPAHAGNTPACCCHSGTGEPIMGPVTPGGLPSATVRGRLPPLIPLTALSPVQHSMGWECWGRCGGSSPLPGAKPRRQQNCFFLFFQLSVHAWVPGPDVRVLRTEAGQRGLSLQPSLPLRLSGLLC